MSQERVNFYLENYPYIHSPPTTNPCDASASPSASSPADLFTFRFLSGLPLHLLLPLRLTSSPYASSPAYLFTFRFLSGLPLHLPLPLRLTSSYSHPCRYRRCLCSPPLHPAPPRSALRRPVLPCAAPLRLAQPPLRPAPPRAAPLRPAPPRSVRSACSAPAPPPHRQPPPLPQRPPLCFRSMLGRLASPHPPCAAHSAPALPPSWHRCPCLRSTAAPAAASGCRPCLHVPPRPLLPPHAPAAGLLSRLPSSSLCRLE